MNLFEKIEYVISKGMWSLKKKEYREKKKLALKHGTTVHKALKPSGIKKLYEPSPYIQKKIAHKIQVSKNCRNGQLARWARYTPEERAEQARKMAESRARNRALKIEAQKKVLGEVFDPSKG